MYKQIIKHKENIINQHFKRLNGYKAEMKLAENKMVDAFEELKALNYNNEQSFFETQNKMLYLRQFITSLKKEVIFFENYIRHEEKSLKELNIEKEKFIHLQTEIDIKKKSDQEMQEEEEYLEFLNIKRK